MSAQVNVTVLAGGVGGAKMAEGFAALEDVSLSIIGNVADDDFFHGLWVSPDIDTLTYSLAGMIDRTQGWGVADEGHRALSVLNTLGADTWMSLGDRDFGLHIYRSQRLSRGDRPSEIAADVARKFGVQAQIILPTDQRVQTKVRTDNGWLSFQEYFVREKCVPDVRALAYEGLDQANATPEALNALRKADLVVIAPSNPLVSIAPILGVKGIRETLTLGNAPIFAVSPLIAGSVVKGPADRMMAALGHQADVLGIAELYKNLADAIFIDNVDYAFSAKINALGLRSVCSDILMPDQAEKRRLASEILNEFRLQKESNAA